LHVVCHTSSVHKAITKRTHVILPVDLVAAIDKMVGKRGRSAFLVEVIRDEVQRLAQRRALKAAVGAWKDEDHPELKRGAAAWVEQMRNESKTRVQRAQGRGKKR
jgi:Arc/MetJ-type ribon-helix-helix transcriptional regulator